MYKSLTSFDEADEVIEKRYSNEYFVIEGESERQQEEYSTQFRQFGGSIIAIEVRGVRNINNVHWIIQLVHNHTPNLKMLRFYKCSFVNIDDFLSQHKRLTHLAFRSGSCKQGYKIRLPEYRNLKAFESSKFRHIRKSSLEQVILNNPQMESLILRSTSCDNYFNLEEVMKLVSNNLKQLKELNILDSCLFGQTTVQSSLMDKFATSLTHLQSLGITIKFGVVSSLLPILSSNCINIKQLEIYIWGGYFSDVMIQKVCAFDKIEVLSIISIVHNCELSLFIERFPYLRSLSISMMVHRTNGEILSILRICTHLDTFVIETDRPSSIQDEDEIVTDYKLNAQFHDEFVQTIRNPKTVIEFKEDDEIIGLVTRDQIVWRNKLLHWKGYDPAQSQSKVQILDLANIPKESKANHKQPINLIFNYLDINSLYSFGMASKVCKSLIHNYVHQRSNHQFQMKPNQPSKQYGRLFVTDEFCINSNALRMFGKCITYLEAQVLGHNLKRFRDEIAKYCVNLTKLCVYMRQRVGPQCFIFPQVKHLIFYGIDDSNSEYICHCDLSELSRICPNLEILELKTPVMFYASNWKKANSFQNLKKVILKSYDNFDLKCSSAFFENKETAVVVI